MQIIDCIEQQMNATQLPLVGVTLAAVPCPDTPVILTLHWHGFIREKLVDAEEADTVAYTPIPSSALQLNERWRDLIAVDAAAIEAGWEFGAWDLARAERPRCTRPGADATEALECLQAFGSPAAGPSGQQVVVADAPDADDLIALAARRGYLLWTFRPVRGGIWKAYAADATLEPDGRRSSPCPHRPIPPRCDARRKTVYRFGVPVADDDRVLNS